MRVRRCVWPALLGLLLLPDAAAAGPCEVALALVDFGRVELREGDEITGRVSVRCEEPMRFALSLTEGRGSYRMRRMRGANGGELRYNLYIDPGRRIVWGDGTGAGTARLEGETDRRGEAELTVYGRILEGQAVPAGAYSDSLTVILEP